MLKLQQSGANWYACYQETHNRELFAKMRLGQNCDQRIDIKISAHDMGLLIEEGLLTGIGETDQDVVDSPMEKRMQGLT